MTRRACACACACAFVLALGAAVADAHAQAPTPGREHFERGTVRYNLGDFEGAIVEFRAAYEVSRAPGLLYNLGQAHRLMKDPERALYFYRTFLREAPDAPNRAEAHQRIAELEPIVEPRASRGHAAPSLHPKLASAGGGPLLFAPAPKAGRTLKIAGFTTGAAGLVLLAIGIGLTVDGRATQDSLVNRRGDGWDDAARAQYGSAQREAFAGNVLDALGAVAVGAGAFLVAIGYVEQARARPQRFAITPTSSGLAFSF